MGEAFPDIDSIQSTCSDEGLAAVRAHEETAELLAQAEEIESSQSGRSGFDVYYPPTAYDTEPIGRVESLDGENETTVRADFLGEEIYRKSVPKDLPLYGLRLYSARRRAVRVVNFRASCQLSYDNQDPLV